MNPVVVEIENILGIERLTVAPGALCVVSGGNGVGKTSLLEAVRAVMSEGHDASLLRAGTEAGAVRLTLADGSTMTKTITAKGSSFEGRHPKLGRISRARAWVDSVVDELGRDPLALVYCPPTKRAELLADLLVVNVSRADLEAAAPDSRSRRSSMASIGSMPCARPSMTSARPSTAPPARSGR